MNELILDGQIYKQWDVNYFVNEHGDVYSAINEIILKHRIDKCGHHTVTLYGKIIRVHRMVYEKWIGPIPDGLLVLHKNDDKDNNHYSNLYVGTYTDNMRDRVRNGHWSNGRSSSKPVVVFDKVTNETLTFKKIRDFLRHIGYTSATTLKYLNTLNWFQNKYEVLSYGSDVISNE